jgi:hypothetical protein
LTLRGRRRSRRVCGAAVARHLRQVAGCSTCTMDEPDGRQSCAQPLCMLTLLAAGRAHRRGRARHARWPEREWGPPSAPRAQRRRQCGAASWTVRRARPNHIACSAAATRPILGRRKRMWTTERGLQGWRTPQRKQSGAPSSARPAAPVLPRVSPHASATLLAAARQAAIAARQCKQRDVHEPCWSCSACSGHSVA